MGADSAIEWTDHTFNPWWGCVKVSPGCTNCYAETWAHRMGFNVWGPAKTTPRREMSDQHWAEPLKWDRAAAKAGRPARVFCASMADVFEDHPALPPMRERLWQLIAQTPNLIWMLLTKRPENMTVMAPASWAQRWPSNVWAMTTVEIQEQAEQRIPELLKVPARVRGLSCEPLLGPVDLRSWLTPCPACGAPRANASCTYCEAWPDVRGVSWVIAGGESGPGARPPHPDWFRSLRNQCATAGVDFFFKQWGEWAPPEVLPREQWSARHTYVEEQYMLRSGKKLSGRQLDGREWNGVPT